MVVGREGPPRKAVEVGQRVGTVMAFGGGW